MQTAYCADHGIERIAGLREATRVGPEDGAATPMHAMINFACGANGSIVTTRRQLIEMRSDG